MGEGTLYDAEIAGITKGEKGNPGEIAGVITYLDQYRLGTVEENTSVGIYGNLEKIPEKAGGESFSPVGFKQEIEEGEARRVPSPIFTWVPVSRSLTGCPNAPY